MSNKSGTRLFIPFVVECADRDIEWWDRYFKELMKHTETKWVLNPSGQIVNNGALMGSPKVVLKKFLELGFLKKYYDKTLIRFFIAWGFYRNYWDDRDLFVEDLKHFLWDKYALDVIVEE